MFQAMLFHWKPQPPLGSKHSLPLLSYWVCGRLFGTPGSSRECFVAYHESAPQLVVEMAFRLAYGVQLQSLACLLNLPKVPVTSNSNSFNLCLIRSLGIQVGNYEKIFSYVVTGPRNYYENYSVSSLECAAIQPPIKQLCAAESCTK